MKTEIGEYIVGAYLKLIKNCSIVDYNVRFPGGDMRGLNELDVIGLNFDTQEVFLCEVTTHLRGMVYVDYSHTIKKYYKSIKFKKNMLKYIFLIFQ